MSIAALILRTYRAPTSVIRDWLDRPRHEGRSLAMLMAGCAIIAVSTLPNLLAQTSDVPREARISAVIFAWLAIAPLVFYVIALLIDFVRTIFGSGTDGYVTRLALFWSVLAATPLWLLNGIGLTIPQPTIRMMCGLVALLGFLVMATANLRAAYRYAE